MMHKVRITLTALILLCLMIVMLLIASLSFGVPFNVQPIKVDSIQLFTTDMKENSSESFVYIKWKNLSFIKDVDYVEFTIKGLDKGSKNFAKIRVKDDECVKPLKPNQKTVFKLPFETDSAKYAVNAEVIAYEDGSKWRNDSESNTIELSMNKETDKGSFPVRITEALAWHSQPNEVQYDLSWNLLNDNADILAIVARARCYDEKGRILSDEEGMDTFYLEITDDYGDESELNILSPWGKESDALLLDNNASSVDTVKVALIKAVDVNGNVYCSNDEPEVSLKTIGRIGFPFEEDTSNESIKAFIVRMEDNFDEEGLDYHDPRIYENERFALIRYSDLDIRVELGENGSVRDGEVSCCKYMDFSDDAEYAVIGKAQTAIMIASMESDQYKDDLKTQLKDLFISGRSGYVDAGDKRYSYLQPFKNYLKDGDSGILTCAMGDEIYYSPSEFFSEME